MLSNVDLLPSFKALKIVTALSASVLLTVCTTHRIALDPPAPTIADDMVSLISVASDRGSKLQHDQASAMTVRLRYTLSSLDRATLVLRLQHFANRESCVAKSSRVVDEKMLAVFRGTHLAEATLEWPGAKDGAVSLEAVMQTVGSEYIFLNRRFGTEFCMQVQ